MINRFRKSRVCPGRNTFVSILETQTAAAGSRRKQPDSAATGTTQARTAATPDDVTPLQQLIQSRPDVLEELRDFLIQRLHQEGSAIDDQSVTDQMLYARLQSDPQFRNDAVQWLVDQGTISPETARGLMTAGGAAGVPSSARRRRGLQRPSRKRLMKAHSISREQPPKVRSISRAKPC